jgi:glycosyltransferase involved in cell wall biosynthesis
MKNLDGALRILAKTQDHVILDIYGPNEDPSYWKECQSLIEQLPGNLQISYLGPILHEQVADTLSQYHVLFLPTLGENYGHIIVEALQSGCLVIISDRTPWRNLAQAHVGWDLPLESTASFVSAIHEAAQMDEAKFRAWSTSARQFAASSPLVTSAYRANRSFLQTLCSGFQ